MYGRNVLVKTDSSVVKWVIERADATKNDRLRRWLMELRGVDFSAQHLKGASNTVADALSRSPVDYSVRRRGNQEGSAYVAGDWREAI